VRDEGRLQSYILEGVLPVLSTAFQDCSRSLVCRATGLLSCYYPFSYFLLYFTSHSYLSCTLSLSIILQCLRLIKLAENIVIKEQLDNPFSVRPIHDKVWIVNKGRPTPPIPNLITHYKSYIEWSTRHVCISQYDSKFYCWFCLLFSNKHEGVEGFKSLVKCAAKTLKITNSRALLCTVKIIWTTTKGWLAPRHSAQKRRHLA
jgi:hypothetical protein